MSAVTDPYVVVWVCDWRDPEATQRIEVRPGQPVTVPRGCVLIVLREPGLRLRVGGLTV